MVRDGPSVSFELVQGRRSRQPSARVPVHKEVHCHDYWCKLQAAKVDFVSRQSRHQALRSLRQPKARPQVHGQSRDDERNDKAPADRRRTLPGSYQSPEQHGQEDGKREHLEREAGQEDVVGSRRILLVGIRHSHQSRTCDLDDRRHDVAHDENP